MPYRLKRKENTRRGVRRIAREQIDRAHKELTQAVPAPAEAVHQARKRIKKLRGLLRLVRPALGESAYKKQNRRLRAAAHTLADTRDAEVMLETLEALALELQRRGHAIDLSGLRETLRARRAAHDNTEADDAEPPGQAAAHELATLRAKVGDWSLDRSGFAATGPGFRRIYRRGRKAMQRARKHPGDRQFHDWRKRAKDHWYHCRLLRYTWPNPLRTRADELKTLSDLLGDDHDLAVFRHTLRQLPPSLLTPPDAALLEGIIRERQRALRSDALTLGRRVYAEKPRRIHARFRRYARAARG